MSIERVELVTVSPNGQLFTIAVGQPTSGGAVPFLAALQLPSVLNQAGATPNQVTSASDAVDAVQVVGESPENGFAGMLVIARGTVFNGATWDRAREVAGDAQAATGIPVSHPTKWNGATYDRSYSASAANIAAQSGKGAQIVANPGAWTITSNPGAGNQATATKAAGAAGVRHVLTSIYAGLINSAITAQAGIAIVVRDGASGVGTILWQGIIGAGGGSAATQDIADSYAQSNLNIVGSPATAMTVEFTGAGLATTSQFVNGAGYDAS